MPQRQSSPPTNGPLTDILVIDHTTALAGPYCTQVLGDLGAEVIKVERPGTGDQARGWGPPFIGGESAYFMGTNRNKRSLTLDLSQAAGREILQQLFQQADVLVHNIPRQSSRKKLGLDQETCLSINPGLIWASITGFGNSGPYAEQPGYDVTIQGMSGTMYMTGEPDSGPTRFPTPISDITTGLYTALAIVSALFVRHQTGQGQVIDNALFDCQVTWLANLASGYLMASETPKKLGNAHPNIVPYQPFPTADGWIIIGAGSERHWQRLIELLELPELGDDPRFATNADRLAHRDELIPLLSERLRQHPTAEWQAQLKTAGIPNGVINTPADALNNEQLLARGMIVEFDHPAAGHIRSVGNPIQLSHTPITYRRPAPLLGEHTTEILGKLGYSNEEIERLKQEKVV
jgi:crotonobetainyl-CoA:carnitine CoA-transferase CaiB-like acyl-CoA transferase